MWPYCTSNNTAIHQTISLLSNCWLAFTHMRARTHTHTHTHMCARTHAYIHTQTHIKHLITCYWRVMPLFFVYTLCYKDKISSRENRPLVLLTIKNNTIISLFFNTSHAGLCCPVFTHMISSKQNYRCTKALPICNYMFLSSILLTVDSNTHGYRWRTCIHKQKITHNTKP